MDLVPTNLLLTSRNCFSFSLPGTLRRMAFRSPLGDSRLSSLWAGGCLSAPCHCHPKGTLGTGWDSLVLDLRAGADVPRRGNGGSIVEDQVLAAELDIFGPCQVPL